MMSLDAFCAHLEQAIAEVGPAIEVGLDKVGTLALTLAAEYPGHYQPGWPALAESTIKDKEAKGFPIPSPLKRTGEMAASYAKELVPAELAVVVGSPDKVALYQEMGTSRIPPRPVTAIAMQHALPYAADVFGEVAVALLTGKSKGLLK